MKHFILATDNPESPKRSAIVMGPEEDDDKVRRAFYDARSKSCHPDGSRCWELWTRTGRIEVSIASKNPEPKKGTNK